MTEQELVASIATHLSTMKPCGEFSQHALSRFLPTARAGWSVDPLLHLVESEQAYRRIFQDNTDKTTPELYMDFSVAAIICQYVRDKIELWEKGCIYREQPGEE